MPKKKEVIIVGSGLAALVVARHLQSECNVTVLTKGKSKEAHSYLAQGGVAAVVHPSDSIAAHCEDTMSAGCYTNDKAVVERFVALGQKSVKYLIQEGVCFDKTEDGEIALGLEGAHSAARILHIGGDQTGKYLTSHFLNQVKGNVSLMEQ
ncbi:MAG: FAD-binding protein, partial [Bacilli bacterium]